MNLFNNYDVRVGRVAQFTPIDDKLNLIKLVIGKKVTIRIV